MIPLLLFNWCPNCSWWLIPLLLGAWILGWLFWSWTRGASLSKEVKGLHADVKNWKTKFNTNQSELETTKSEYEKLSGEYATMRTNLADYDSKYRTLEAKYNNALTAEVNATTEPDVSAYTHQIAELENQLETSRNTNLKLQDDYAALKTKFADLELQVSNVNDGPYQGVVGNIEADTKISELESQLAEAKSKVTHLEATNQSLQGDLDTLAAQTQQQDDNQPDVAVLNDRIIDLEKKLAIAYENNTKMEADYAELKSNYGDMEIQLAETSDTSVDETEVEDLKTRITELELLLASRSTEKETADGPGESEEKKKKKNKKKKKKKKGKKKQDEKIEVTSSGTKSSYALAFGEDNLQIVEGIGPKIESVLKAADVKTWKALSETEVEKLREILLAQGPRYKMHDPTTWPDQAAWAKNDEWEALINFQKQLGSADDKITDSKVEKLYAKAIGFKTFKVDDLKVVEGIGPKIEGLLKDAKIDTWEKLSKASVEDIQKVLDAAGSRYKLADPGTWAKQAQIAVDRDWEALKIYQDELKGGKE
ncbi:MAG: helix-hairpin-helix domain-containing protein [Bacteroidota bacterium]